MSELSKEDFDNVMTDITRRLETMDEKIDSLITIDGKNMLDNKDLMRLLKVTERCLIRWRKNKFLPSLKIGGKVFFPAHVIHNFINREFKKQNPQKPQINGNSKITR